MFRVNSPVPKTNLWVRIWIQKNAPFRQWKTRIWRLNLQWTANTTILERTGSYGSVWLDSPRSALPVDVVQGKSMYSVTVTVHRFIHNTWVFGQIFLQPWLIECFKILKNPRIILHPEKLSSDHKLVENWQVANRLEPSLPAGQWSKHLCLLLNKCLFTKVLIDYKHLEQKNMTVHMYAYINYSTYIYIYI